MAGIRESIEARYEKVLARIPNINTFFSPFMRLIDEIQHYEAALSCVSVLETPFISP